MVSDGGVDIGAALRHAQVARVGRLGREAVGQRVHMPAQRVQRGRAVAVQHRLQLRLIWLRQAQRCAVLLHSRAVLPALEQRIARLAAPCIVAITIMLGGMIPFPLSAAWGSFIIGQSSASEHYLIVISCSCSPVNPDTGTLFHQRLLE